MANVRTCKHRTNSCRHVEVLTHSFCMLDLSWLGATPSVHEPIGEILTFPARGRAVSYRNLSEGRAMYRSAASLDSWGRWGRGFGLVVPLARARALSCARLGARSPSLQLHPACPKTREDRWRRTKSVCNLGQQGRSLSLDPPLWLGHCSNVAFRIVPVIVVPFVPHTSRWRNCLLVCPPAHVPPSEDMECGLCGGSGNVPPKVPLHLESMH